MHNYKKPPPMGDEGGKLGDSFLQYIISLALSSL